MDSRVGVDAASQTSETFCGGHQPEKQVQGGLGSVSPNEQEDDGASLHSVSLHGSDDDDDDELVDDENWGAARPSIPAIRFNDEQVVFVRDDDPDNPPPPRHHGDWHVPIGPFRHETYAFEREPRPTIAQRLQREMVNGIDVAVARGNNLAATVAEVGGNAINTLAARNQDLAAKAGVLGGDMINDVVARGYDFADVAATVGGYALNEAWLAGMDITAVVKRKWPGVRAHGERWLQRAGVPVNEGMAAAPPSPQDGRIEGRENGQGL